MRKREAVWVRAFRAGLVGDPREHGYTGGSSNAWNDGYAIGSQVGQARDGERTVSDVIRCDGSPMPILSPYFNPWN